MTYKPIQLEPIEESSQIRDYRGNEYMKKTPIFKSPYSKDLRNVPEEAIERRRKYLEQQDIRMIYSSYQSRAAAA